MQFVLIRHSQTVLNSNVDIKLWGLSQIGIEKAQQLANQPIIKELNTIYSSLQNKALETSVILAKPNHIPIKTDPGLGEVTSVTNKFLENFEQDMENFLLGKVKNLSNGETLNEAFDRFSITLEKIASKEKTASMIGIVTHGTTLSAFASHYSAEPITAIHKSIQMPDTAVFDWSEKKFIKFFNYKS